MKGGCGCETYHDIPGVPYSCAAFFAGGRIRETNCSHRIFPGFMVASNYSKRQINPIFRSQYDYAMVCHYQPTMEASHENSQSQTFVLVRPYQGMEFFRALSSRILPRIPSQIKFLHLLEAPIQRNSKPPRLDPCSGLTGNPTSRAFVNPSHHSSWQYLVH